MLARALLEFFLIAGCAAQWGECKDVQLERANRLADDVSRLEQEGKYGEALALAREVVEIRQKRLGSNDQSNATAASLNELGVVYLLTGEYAAAQREFDATLRICEHSLGETNPLTADALSNLGVVDAMMGENSRAQALTERSLRLFEGARKSNPKRVAACLDNLASLTHIEGDNAKARLLYNRVLAMQEKLFGPESKETAATLDNIASACLAQGNLQEAEPLLKRALVIDEKTVGTNHPQYAAVLNDLGERSLKSKKPGDAEAFLWQALAIAEQSQALSLVNRIRYNLRDALADEGRTTAAIFMGKEAVNTLQQMRGKQLSMDSELQNSFVGIRGGYYRGLAALLIDAGRFSEAQQVLNMLKEEEYFEFIRRDAGAAQKLGAVVGLTLKEKQEENAYDAARTNLVAMAREKLQLEAERQSGTSTPEKQARLKQILPEYAAAAQAFRAVLKRIGEEPGRGEADANALASLATMRFALKNLGKGTVLINYVVTPRTLYVLMTTPEIQTFGTTNIDEQTLNNYIWDFQKALKHPRDNPLPLAQALYNIILGPIAVQLQQAGATTLMVSLDGALRYVPFAALHDGQRYLVETCRVVESTMASGASIEVSPAANWRVAALGLSRSVSGFEPLPYVKEELEGIVRVPGGSAGVLPGIIRLDDQFTEEELFQAPASNTVMHIASHFVFRPGTTDDSYLVLGNGGSLTLEQIRTNDLRFDQVDLLTLSACETGVSEKDAGGGGELEGFATLAQEQGAKAILATLWPVADVSTCDLMKDFYSQHGEAGAMDKAGALQRAQLDLLKGASSNRPGAAAQLASRGIHFDAGTNIADGGFVRNPAAPYAHPYYWAPFILVGNWK